MTEHIIKIQTEFDKLKFDLACMEYDYDSQSGHVDFQTEMRLLQNVVNQKKLISDFKKKYKFTLNLHLC
jgi:hypothetical protein